MSGLTLTLTEVLEATPDVEVIEQSRVILFNDEWHSFEEVIDQLILAINCSAKTAEEMAWTVHTQGQCEVFTGGMEDCLEVSAVLEAIELKTEIRFAS